MPRYNKNALRKYYYKGRRMPPWSVNAQPGLLAIANRALSVAKHTKGLLNVEYKFFDTVLTAAGGSSGNGVDDAGEYHDLLAIPQGDTAETRDGNSIRLKSINCKGTINLAGAATFSRVRLFLVEDTQPNGGGSSFTGVFDTADIDRLFLNKASPGRFKVHASRAVTVSTNAGENVVHFSMYLKTNKKIMWGGAGTTDPYNTNYMLLMISDQSVNEPGHDIKIRATYVDN